MTHQLPEARTIDQRMLNVGLFGYWLEQNNYGKYLEWQVKRRNKKRAERCVVGCERNSNVTARCGCRRRRR